MSDESTIITDCPYCNTAMDISAVAPFTRVACPSCHGEMRVKVRFGPYQLERRLAIGGMSVVFIARDTLLDREVAVKILNEDYSADERRISAFEEEARITASLSHPNIVRVLTTGRAFGRFFIAMELVPGGHFEHHIREAGKVPEKQMLKLAIQIANGLKAAHAANLIHRDIKPGNILLDANGNAKIVDFGLALVTHGGTAQAREFWATPYYVPPETIDGAPEDFRADIYAFGATLYHALAGKPPCNEESMATDILRAAKKNIVPLHQADPNLSTAICRIVDKAMAYAPLRRHTCYEELLRELETAAKNAELGIDGETTHRRNCRERNRRIARAAALMIAGLAVISGLAWMIGGRDDPPAPPPTTRNDPHDAPPPGNSVDLGKLHEDARAAVAARSFGAAVDRFERLHTHPQVLEPTRTWAGVQAVIAAMLDQDETRAKELATGMRAHLATTDADDPEITTTLLPLLMLVETGAPVTFDGVEPSRSGPASLIAWLLVGIHEWQTGSHVAAAPFFETAVKTTLDDTSAWASIYQDVAYDHMADLALLDDPTYLNDPPDLLAAEVAVERMESLRKEVRTRGPIGGIIELRHNEIRRILGRYVREAEQQAEAEKEMQDEPNVDLTNPFDNPPPPDDPPVGPRPDRAMAVELLANYEFRGARHAIREIDEAEIENRHRTVWMTLTRKADDFFTSLRDEMAANAFNVTQVKLKSGETHEQLRTGSDDGLTDDDGNLIPWAAVHADAYIEWHRARARRVTDELERTRMHEEAIAFDLLAGDRQRAGMAIERITEDDPDLDRYWSFILSNLPQ